MKRQKITGEQIKALDTFFGSNLKKGVMMGRYSVMRVGGPADFLVIVKSSQDLAKTVSFLWEKDIPFIVLGAGSNTLISDTGISDVVVINKAKEVRFISEDTESPKLWAESGASFGKLARRTASKGWTGLEWSAGIPGTVGGAVVNNAGAFGSSMAETLVMAEILHPSMKRIQRSEWSVDQFAYGYRTSVIKTGNQPAVVLSATFQLQKSTPKEVKGRISSISEQRQSSQPHGASLGSMFKNPPGDFAGRLIEQAGLKGTRVGDAEISLVHGNFFLNRGNATAEDIADLITLVKKGVKDQFGIELELEIQFLGNWE